MQVVLEAPQVAVRKALREPLARLMADQAETALYGPPSLLAHQQLREQQVAVAEGAEGKQRL